MPELSEAELERLRVEAENPSGGYFMCPARHVVRSLLAEVAAARRAPHPQTPAEAEPEPQAEPGGERVTAGNEIWEALFSILKGNVPDELTEDVCEQLAADLRLARPADHQPTEPSPTDRHNQALEALRVAQAAMASEGVGLKIVDDALIAHGCQLRPHVSRKPAEQAKPEPQAEPRGDVFAEQLRQAQADPEWVAKWTRPADHQPAPDAVREALRNLHEVACNYETTRSGDLSAALNKAGRILDGRG